jgi:hypothetical protein
MHLSQLFPATYQPPTRADDEHTSFSNLRGALAKRQNGLLSKLFG